MEILDRCFNRRNILIITGVIFIFAPLFFSRGEEVSVSVNVFVTPAPENLTASVISSSQINLSWSAVAGAAYYNLYRDAVLFASTTAFVYSDTGLASATQYSYAISSVDSGGTESSLSGSVLATTQTAAVSASAESGLGGQGSPSKIYSATKTPKPVVVSLTFQQGDRAILNFHVSGATQMQVSNLPDFSGAQWEPYQTKKEWRLLPGPGPKIVYARFMNEKGKISNVYFDSAILSQSAAKASALEEIGKKIEEIRQALLKLQQEAAARFGPVRENNQVLPQAGSSEGIQSQPAETGLNPEQGSPVQTEQFETTSAPLVIPKMSLIFDQRIAYLTAIIGIAIFLYLLRLVR